MTGNLFDRYSLEARLRPALLVWLPVIAFVYAWTPTLYSLVAGLAGAAVAFGLTVVLAHFARIRGQKIQDILLSEWGAFPTVTWLRHSTTTLNSETKKRYHKFFEAHVPDWTAPTAKDEAEEPEAADIQYESAVQWLLEHTRDQKKYHLVFAENVSYGFRRNSLGMRPFAVLLAAISLFATITLLPRDIRVIAEMRLVPQLAAGLFSVLAILWWVFGVNKGWVRKAAESYARALLAVCDSDG